jgi:hypothetical protein
MPDDRSGLGKSSCLFGLEKPACSPFAMGATVVRGSASELVLPIQHTCAAAVFVVGFLEKLARPRVTQMTGGG